ncbi:hypothetical protein SBRCBS47491_002455 [Sporothrix bragantina]|uniref:Ankyrin repeat protein n=1 Tax=Sporothrix bragantina TaxID=671064 RepID=A0ABP0B7S8_9PEZI
MWLYDNRSTTELDLPGDFPILSDGYGGIWITDAIDRAITGGDLPAVHELIRLLGPDVLYLCDMGETSENLTPTALHVAAECGCMDILAALLDYRDNLPADERDRRDAAYERDEQAMEDPFQRPWGTPLTTACMAGHEEVVYLLLERMPEVDVNASDKFGYTPLQSVSRCALSARSFEMNVPHMDPDEPARRMAIVKMLLAKGAVPRATTGRPEPHFRYSGRAGRPNPLILTLMADRGLGDAALTRFFIDEVGINAHAGFTWCTARMDSRGVNGVADDEEGVYIDGYDAAQTNDVDIYLTPLATATLFGNAAGVEALLRTPNTNFAADLVPATGLPPPRSYSRPIQEPGGPDPSYRRPIRFVHDNKVFLGKDGEMDRPLSKQEREAYRAAWKAASIADRTAYIDSRVATVQLLTAEAASVCKSFDINATHAGYTPLHLGARFDRLPLLRVLLNRRADPRIPIPGGMTVFAAVVASIHRLCVARWSRVAND